MVCRGACAEPILDSYSIERSAIGDEVLKNAGRLTQVATLRNHSAQTLRNLVAHAVLGLAPVRQAMVDTITEVSVGYRHSPLNGAGAHGLSGPAPGERAPPVAGQMPAGAGDTPRFALCGKQSAALTQLTARYPELLDPDIRPPLGADGTWLVRPDGYTACAVRSEHSDLIAEYLHVLKERG
jgi:hypothetical protein